ncbi:hypothetical protein JCM8097_002440 [Rhodosporidiobolus ruineniae]
MLPLPRRKPSPGLPTTRFVPSSPSSSSSPSSTYKDKNLRPRSLRLRLSALLWRPPVLLGLFVGVLLVAGWALGLFGGGGGRVRMGGGPRVVARDWEAPLAGGKEARGAPITLANGTVLPAQTYSETVLILCPMRNALEHIWHFFHLLDSLSYPHHLIHLAILVSDSTDRTYARALELADERQYARSYSGKRFGRVSVFRRDFAERENRAEEEGRYGGENVGAERHAYSAQVGRRRLLAKSRTWLLSAALTPEVDYALWLDVDLVDYEPGMVERLLAYAKGEIVGEGEEKGRGADVVVPNCVWKTYNEMGAYDRNNWLETPESRALKKTLNTSDVLIEGYTSHPTHRFNLAALVPSTPDVLSPFSDHLLSPSYPLSSLPSSQYPPSGVTLPAALEGAHHVPETLELDGVGGCAALVRADVHREGAVFPSWPVEHQLETEGFAQLVKAVRARPRGGGGEGDVGRGRMLGLPGYYVYHGLYG